MDPPGNGKQNEFHRLLGAGEDGNQEIKYRGRGRECREKRLELEDISGVMWKASAIEIPRKPPG